MSESDIALIDIYSDDDYGLQESSPCWRCDGEGELHICIDDLCQDRCIHGDGDILCPICDGEGELYLGAGGE